jgi:cell shape-determining protein MreD
MPETRLGLWIALFASLAFSLIVPSFFSTLKFYFFVPSLIIAFYYLSITTITWLSLIIGLLLDVLSASPRFGFLGISYLLTSLFLYPWRLYFFKDAASTLPALTFFYSLCITVIQSLIALLFDLHGFSWSLYWLFTDVVMMPMMDSVYAVLIFSLPHFIYTQYYRIRKQRSSRHAD